MNISGGKEIIENEWEHVHEFGDESEHSQGKMSNWSGKQFDTVDDQKGISITHKQSDENAEDKDDSFWKTSVVISRLDEVKTEMNYCWGY